MNQREWVDTLGHLVAKSAIQLVNDEWVIQGKWCIISFIGSDQFDVFICNPQDLAKGLGTRKLHILMSHKNLPGKGQLRELKGEAYSNVALKDLTPDLLAFLGVRKKIVLSEKRKAELAAQLKRARA